MNGAHDMGGRGGFGAVQAEANEPVFHAAWEARLFALANLVDGGWTLDEDRHANECRSPQDYLRSSYYETWLSALERLVDNKGLSRKPPRSAPVSRGDVLATQLARGSYVRDVSAPPLLQVGDTVRVRNIQTEGHTRLTGYLRGQTGVVVRHHGAHVFPDSNAHGKGEDPRHLYTVRFRAADVFGGNSRDTVHADLWEPYLERI
jgi:nitrile hydratase subunit beta